MDRKPEVDSGTLKTLSPGLAGILASVLVVFMGGLVESGIHRWVSPGFHGSSWDFILALCIAVGALACAVVGLIRIYKAPVQSYWLVLAKIAGSLYIALLLLYISAMFI